MKQTTPRFRGGEQRVGSLFLSAERNVKVMLVGRHLCSSIYILLLESNSSVGLLHPETKWLPKLIAYRTPTVQQSRTPLLTELPIATSLPRLVQVDTAKDS